MTSWRYASSSDVGLVRELNEDCIYVDSYLAMVADGMGGHAAGEIASNIAIYEITSLFRKGATLEELVRAVEAANQAIIADADQHPERLGMGTTVVALGLVASDDGLMPAIINVGDSRAYQLRDGALRQITADHSVAEEWVRQGRLTAEEATVHPRRHQLTRTLGIESNVRPDSFPLDAHPGDRVLLCSDGLTNELSDDVIANLACAPHSLDDAVASLVAEANLRGGRDNISVVLLEFDSVTAQPAPETFAAAALPLASTVRPPAPMRTTPRRSRRFTFRAVLFFMAILAVAAAAYASLDWFSKSSYYLGTHVDSPGTPTMVAVYQGQPGGLLWFKPIFIQDTRYKLSQLLLVDQAQIQATVSEPTLEAALKYADFLGRGHNLLFPTTTTTVTSTTLVANGG